MLGFVSVPPDPRAEERAPRVQRDDPHRPGHRHLLLHRQQHQHHYLHHSVITVVIINSIIIIITTEAASLG